MSHFPNGIRFTFDHYPLPKVRTVNIFPQDFRVQSIYKGQAKVLDDGTHFTIISTSVHLGGAKDRALHPVEIFHTKHTKPHLYATTRFLC